MRLRLQLRRDPRGLTRLQHDPCGENRQRLPALLTDERHIPFSRAVDYRQVQPRRVLDYLSTSKNNGNNVDVEQEMVSAIENQLLYQTMSQAIASEFTRVNIVLR